jgi:HAD superfamily hydrolase (TIGR01490 family)
MSTTNSRQSNLDRPFAVFDIDGTLIRWQLYHAVVSELASRGHLSDDAEATIQAARLTWKKRTSSNSYLQYEGVVVQTYLDAIQNVSPADYLQVVDDVFEEYKDQVYTFTRDLIRSLKSRKYLLFAISSSQAEIVAKLARYYGFDDYIGARFEKKNGHFTGKVDSPFGKKAELLQQLITKHQASQKGSIAVGDSSSDSAMLEIVEQPIAFNPDRKLLEAARQHGWKIVVERKNVIYKLESSNGSYQLNV